MNSIISPGLCLHNILSLCLGLRCGSCLHDGLIKDAHCILTGQQCPLKEVLLVVYNYSVPSKAWHFQLITLYKGCTISNHTRPEWLWLVVLKIKRNCNSGLVIKSKWLGIMALNIKLTVKRTFMPVHSVHVYMCSRVFRERAEGLSFQEGLENWSSFLLKKIAVRHDCWCIQICL